MTWAISRSPCKRSWMEVGCILRSFILRSAQQEEALHRIWYALRSNVTFVSKSLSHVCTTTLCPTTDWPLVT
ncbi:unnamed protein product [Spirodela intermedia]|uniref:Uncharacterized protein n=1 Tax=Spirodela intermedia TaxID=51605 RepID=A0ABN7EAN8_SPIIN|nr:unnamed protein product [Spirodela intermedia]